MEESKLYIVEIRNELIWELSYRGFSNGVISQAMNGLDRTWISRIVKKMPKKWTPLCLAHKKRAE